MKYFLSFAIIILLLSSCCKKLKCVVPAINMKLYNFSREEADSIIVYKYEKGNNFVTALDSTYLSSSLSNDNQFYSVYSNIENSNFDYLIKIKGFTMAYRITDLRTEKSKCNRCGPFTRKSDYFTVLADYRVNGQLKNDFVIEVYK
jgi:hypothetical protein